MKKSGELLRSYIGHVGAYFMFTVLAFVLFSSMLGTAKNTFRLSLVLTSLVFAMLTGVIDYVFTMKLPFAAKTAVHGVLTVTAFALSFSLVGGMAKEGRTVLFGTLAFAVLYLIIACVRIALHAASEKKAKKEVYHDLYTPKDLDN